MANAYVELGEVDIIGDTIQILLDCEEKGQNPGNQLLPPIYMVPSVFRDLSPSSFDPRVVSIGPLHREHKNVQGMEGQKATYLHHLLRRIDPLPKQTLKACVQKVKDSIDRIKACYAGMTTYGDVQLATMMVMDGCFILEFILRVFYKCDSIQTNMLVTQYILYDLLLLENQMPFFVLQDIFECTISKFKPEASLTCFTIPDSLTCFIIPVLRSVNLFDANLETNNLVAGTSNDHILSLLHKCYQPEYIIPPGFSTVTNHSAVQLDRAGVNFKRNEDENWPLAMELKLSRFGCFSWPLRKATLKMPVLLIDDFTELVLRNLIAYEQYSLDRYYVTSYAAAMDMLVNTQEDVAKLVESDVLVNNLGSNKEAANMMNFICKEAASPIFFYAKQWDQLHSYYIGYWPRKIAWLRRTYFSSPWNIIALLAGIILFTLAVVQTVFTIKAK